jgi:glutamate 5-kinase
MVCSGGPLLVRAWMQQVAQLRRKGVEIIWVTSGAIASAVDRTELGARKGKRKLAEKQALASIGQPIVMDLYNIALAANGLLGAQLLLTYDDIADRSRCANFRTTLEKLIEWQVVPVINENDTVATEEIRFGDNDSLSAKVARVAHAERLVILTDVDGLYDKDPKTSSSARLIQRLPTVTQKLLSSVAPTAGSTRGTGGMYSKLNAAREAARAGIETWLVKGDLPAVLMQIAENRSVGTLVERGAK